MSLAVVVPFLLYSNTLVLHMSLCYNFRLTFYFPRNCLLFVPSMHSTYFFTPYAWWEQLHSHLSINFVCISNNSNFAFSLTLKDNISDVCWSKIKNINNTLSSYSKIIMLFQSFLILTRVSWKSQWSQGVFLETFTVSRQDYCSSLMEKNRLLVEM